MLAFMGRIARVLVTLKFKGVILILKFENVI